MDVDEAHLDKLADDLQVLIYRLVTPTTNLARYAIYPHKYYN